MARPRIKVPETAKSGDIVTIKTLLSHRMESGHREDPDGRLIPQQIINSFTCEFNGTKVFACKVGTGVAANPFFEFTAKITEAGTFKFTWVDDDGTITEASREISLV